MIHLLFAQWASVFHLARDQQRAIVGDYTFDGKILTFRNRPETKLCVDETGVYEIKINGALLIARKVKDTCPLREKQMDHSWTRLKAAGPGSSAPASPAQ